MSRHQARWLELMQEFDYELIYKPGTTNRVADPLSRRQHELNHISVVNIPDTELEKYKQRYIEDPYLKNLYQFFLEQESLLVADRGHVPKELHLKVKHYK